jgi:hypothetical protein
LIKIIYILVTFGRLIWSNGIEKEGIMSKIKKMVIYGLCALAYGHGLAMAQEIDACGAEIVVTQYDKSLMASITYQSLECVEREDSLEAEKAFHKPQEHLQQRLRLSLNQGFLSSTGAFTLVVIKDGEVVAREESNKPWTTDHRRGGSYQSSLSWWAKYNKPVELPFECVLMKSYKSEHVLRFMVKAISTKGEKFDL